jgi:colanic acid/amylovoran biosynthesis glycosyltransferase
VRALVLVHTFPSRTQTFVLNQVTGLLGLGCDVRVLAKDSDYPDVASWPAAASVPGLAERVTWLRPPARRGRAGPAAQALALAACCLVHPLRALRAFAVSAATGDVSALQGLLAARSLEVQGPFDVMHCQFGSIANMAIVLQRAGIVSAPIVTSFRGSDLTSYLRRVPRAYRLLAASGARFLPVCSPLVGTLEHLGVPRERVEVHFSGIDVGQFPFRMREAPSARPVRLLAVGRMTGKKGFRHLVEAVRLLTAAGREVTLTLVGDGPDRRRLETAAEAGGLSHAVEFRGIVSHAEVAGLMACHDVLVAPSVTDESGDREGIPNVLKEAMACGLPVVATRHSGIPDLIDDEVDGLLVPEGDPRALAGRLAALLDDPAAWPRLSASARAKVERLFDRDGLNARLLKIYEESAELARAGG